MVDLIPKIATFYIICEFLISPSLVHFCNESRCFTFLDQPMIGLGVRPPVVSPVEHQQQRVQRDEEWRLGINDQVGPVLTEV